VDAGVFYIDERMLNLSLARRCEAIMFPPPAKGEPSGAFLMDAVAESVKLSFADVLLANASLIDSYFSQLPEHWSADTNVSSRVPSLVYRLDALCGRLSMAQQEEDRRYAIVRRCLQAARTARPRLFQM
jgi:hypothetical protein